MVIKENHDKPDLSRQSKTMGRTMDGDGYVIVRKPNHPNANNNYVREHRLVMEKHLRRMLRPDEIIHHKNKVKTDNRIENLELLTAQHHRRLHNTLDKKGVRKYNVKEIEKLYSQGFSGRYIAKQLGIGKSTVASYVKELGISRSNMSARNENGQFIKREVV